MCDVKVISEPNLAEHCPDPLLSLNGPSKDCLIIILNSATGFVIVLTVNLEYYIPLNSSLRTTISGRL